MPVIIFITVYIFVIIVNLTDGITKCDKKSACSCMGDNGLVDLSPLTGSGAPRFKDVQAGTGDKFSWNPCTPFSEGNCQNVAACQVQSQAGTQSAFFNIGNQDSAKFSVEGGALKLSYSADTFTGPGLGFQRSAVITLVCDSTTEAQLIARGEMPAGSGKYLMTLNSKYACEQTGGGGNVTVTGGLSVGSILVIVAIVLVLVYILAGISVQKFVRKAEGREVVPNITFWSALPGLVKDGVVFTVRCVKRDKNYNKI